MKPLSALESVVVDVHTVLGTWAQPNSTRGLLGRPDVLINSEEVLGIVF